MSTLAAARADNFYYPPEWNPKKGSLNKFRGQHPLRERAKKIDQGILVIRFEMPFHIWCGGCNSMIAKGVRFNSEKKQVGNYFSTKIWSFKMKSACCQHEIEIQTDPKNCDYVIVSGAERKIEEYDPLDAGTQLLPDNEERAKLNDPLFKLEHINSDKAKAKLSEAVIISLKEASDAKHSDSYRQNRALRDKLRAQKKRVAAEEEEARSLGLGIRLLPRSDEDRVKTSMVVFKPKFNQNLKTKRAIIQASSIFANSSSHGRTASAEAALLKKRRAIDAVGAVDLINSRTSSASKEPKRAMSGKYRRC